MSNAYAIATVTTALAQIVRTAAQSIVSGSDVLTERPDGAAVVQPRVRLFLYQVAPNAGMRNNDLPARSANGTLQKRPTVALDLHYLLAFYGNETDLEPQRMLGAVVRDLHAKPVLLRQMIDAAIASKSPILDGSNLADSVEQIKITPAPMTLEEMSKLWSIFFQTPYSLSVAYLATVVLIESDDTPLLISPVLQRGKDDRGVDVVLGTFPTLQSIHIGEADDDASRLSLGSYPSARLGATVSLQGNSLGGDTVTVEFKHTRFPIDIQKAAQSMLSRPGMFKVLIPNDEGAQNQWAAGVYTISALVLKEGETRRTNSLPLSFAPIIKSILPNPGTRDSAGNVTLSITCEPKVLKEQQATLLIADMEISSAAHPATTDTLQFELVKSPALSNVLVRLRVDGVDSLPFILKLNPPQPPQFVFGDTQRVSIQ